MTRQPSVCVRPAVLLVGLAACTALWAQGSEPHATVGRAVALTVELTRDDAPQGMVFPIRVRVAPGAGRYAANAPMDEAMRHAVEAASRWVAAHRGEEGYQVPDAFPDAADLLIEFPPEAQKGVVVGDSAGVALACAIYSAVSGTPIRDDVAMTGAVDGEGKIHAVAGIRTKLDGVLGEGLSTMILPAENWWRTEAEARELWNAAAPRVRLVFASTLDDAFFFAFGINGPHGAAYQDYRARLEGATGLLEAGQQERARNAFAEMLAVEPGDSTALIWRREAEVRYSHSLVDAGFQAVREARLPTARLLLERAGALADGPDSPGLRELTQCLEGRATPPEVSTPALPTSWSSADGVLPVRILGSTPESPTDSGWSLTEPVSAPAGEAGDLALACASGDGHLSLAVSWKDLSGSVEQDAGRWYPGEAGFLERSREDRLAVAFGNRDEVASAATTALDLSSSTDVDAWVFGAGPLRASGYALDLGLSPREWGCDGGDPPLFRNEAGSGGPLGSWDGLLGQEADPGLLWTSEATTLQGDLVRGQAIFAARCANCHGASAPGVQGLVPERVAWDPEGSQAGLERRLTTDREHRRRVPEGGLDDLIAYVRAAGAPPSWLIAKPSGSAADVALSAVFAEGRWWVVFRRYQITGADDDLPLTAGGRTWAALAVRDGASGTVGVTEPLQLTWR
jgi:mono/diheme cytochrome c family protein